MATALLLLLIIGPGNPPPKLWTICGENMYGYTHYCQADNRWKDIKLYRKKMGHIGCLISAAAIKATGEGGIDATPETIDDYMDAHNGYTSKDWAKWNVVADAISEATGRECEWVEHQTVTHASLRDYKMEDGNFPLLRVRTSHRTNHYVLLVDPRKGIIIDPGTSRAEPHTLAAKGYTPNRISIFRYADKPEAPAETPKRKRKGWAGKKYSNDNVTE